MATLKDVIDGCVLALFMGDLGQRIAGRDFIEPEAFQCCKQSDGDEIKVGPRRMNAGGISSCQRTVASNPVPKPAIVKSLPMTSFGFGWRTSISPGP